MAARQTSDVYFEFTVSGGYIKVAAIDSVDGLEVAILGPKDTPQSELERLVLRKLEFIRARRMGRTPSRAPQRRRGIIA